MPDDPLPPGALVSLQKCTDKWEIVFAQSKYLEYVTDNNRSYSQDFLYAPALCTLLCRSLNPHAFLSPKNLMMILSECVLAMGTAGMVKREP